MKPSNAETVTIAVSQAHTVSGLLCRPARPRACCVLAHGAGAGMAHPFMQAIAAGLATRDIATLRYQFPYMEKGSKRPDAPELAQGTVRAAVAQAALLAPTLPLVAGGKSFGGRMTSQAHAISPLPGVHGLVFIGFPLHRANRPSDERADHLSHVRIAMLFLQGARDALAQAELISSVADRLGDRASLHLIAEADHSFHVPARSGRTDAEVRSGLLDRLAAWTFDIISRTQPG